MEIEYLWRITPRVAVAISNPEEQFKIIDRRHPSIGLLSFDQRKWALELLFSMGRLYRKIERLGNYERYVDVKLLTFFATDMTNSVLVEIYTNLHEWDKAQKLLLSWLQCGKVTAFFADKARKPWPGKTITLAAMTASTAGAQVLMNNFSRRSEWSRPEGCTFIYAEAVNDAIAAFIRLAVHKSRLTLEETQEL